METTEAPEAQAEVVPTEAPAAEPATDAPTDSSLSGESGGDQPSAFPSAEEFGWDDWDGEVGTLPEQIRPWAEPLSSRYTARADERIAQSTKDSTSLKELYEAMLEGKEDPRVAQYMQQIKELEEKHTGALGEWETKYGELEKTHSTYQANVEAAITKEADQYAKWFRAQNEDIFADNTLSATFVALLEEGWEMESAAVAARLPAASIQAARQAKADGVPDAYALRLAGGAESPAAPRPGAKITSGATAPARSSEQAALPEKVEATSFRDLRNQVARTALNKRGR